MHSWSVAETGASGVVRDPRFRRDLRHGPLPRRDGKTGVALQAARLRLSVLRDLWRTGFSLGLRPPRNRAQAQPSGALVARDGAVARRHRGTRFRDPDAPARLGGERPRGRIRGPARGLQDVHGALWRGQTAGPAVPEEAEQEAGRVQ